MGLDQRIYVKYKDNKAIGFLKVGVKQLYYHDRQGKIQQLSPLCLLDFYVDSSVQRLGVGKQLF